MEHLSTCRNCDNQFRRLEQLLKTMRSDREPDAPRDLVAFVLNLFQEGKRSATPSLLRHIIAALSFDSAMNLAPAFGVRSGQASSRQLLYSAEANDIDLRITRQGDRLVVTGQVLGEECAGSEVVLKGETESASASLNQLCEFTLPPVQPGSYALVLRMANLEVEIPDIDLKE